MNILIDLILQDLHKGEQTDAQQGYTGRKYAEVYVYDSNF